MIYTVFNGCMAIAQYHQKAAAIRKAKKTALFNLIDDVESEVTVMMKGYSTDPISIQIFSSYEED